VTLRAAGSAIPLGLGLAASQLAATVLVHQANLDLQREMAAVLAAGYLPVPSPAVTDQLSRWSHALLGGVFFTLTGGSLTVLGAAASLKLARHLAWPTAGQVGLLLFLALLLTAFLNHRGISPGPTLYVWSILAAVAVGARVAAKAPGAPGTPRSRIWPVAGPLMLLAAVWLGRLDGDLFVDIRDRLLLSNPLGAGIAEFYYDYNLLAVQAMAPMRHRTVIGVDLGPLRDEPRTHRLADVLRRVDLLNVAGRAGASIVVRPEGELLRWQDPSGRGLTVGRAEVLERPGAVLERFSRQVDTREPFRLLTLAGILLGFPILLYLLVFGGVEAATALFLGPRAVWAAAAVCLALGGALFYPVATAPGAGCGRDTDPLLWSQGGSAARVSLLRQAARQGTDPLAYPRAGELAHSPRLVERYWFARALGGARSPRAFALAAEMTGDESPMVTCQACFALGEMGRVEAIPLLLAFMRHGNHWYTQRYAYDALRKLGWSQPASSR
jgi:hypothetical protein